MSSAAWGVERFVAELTELGYEPVADGNLVSITWVVPVGSHVGETIQLGWEVTADWPETTPHGPHMAPWFNHPGGGTNPSPFGDDWRQWSRPFNGWAVTDRKMRTYMAFMNKLFLEV